MTMMMTTMMNMLMLMVCSVIDTNLVYSFQPPPVSLAVRSLSTSSSVSAVSYHLNFLKRTKNHNWKMAMADLPDDVIKYSTVPNNADSFTSSTIPSGLLKDHSTKDGTWGVIRILQGSLEYTIYNDNEGGVADDNDDADETAAGGKKETFVLTQQYPGIIEPTVLHSVKALTDDVAFVVEFYRQENTGPVEEPREGLNEE